MKISRRKRRLLENKVRVQRPGQKNTGFTLVSCGHAILRVLKSGRCMPTLYDNFLCPLIRDFHRSKEIEEQIVASSNCAYGKHLISCGLQFGHEI